MIEMWKPVVGWENSYEVSDQGQVRSIDRYRAGPHGSMTFRRGKVLKPRARRYLTVTLNEPGRTPKQASIHLLVLEAFVGPRPLGLVGCHGPGGQRNNAVDNLRWDTQRNNILDQLKYGTHYSGATLEACGQGHEYTPENTYWVRKCRTCNSRKR